MLEAEVVDRVGQGVAAHRETVVQVEAVQAPLSGYFNLIKHMGLKRGNAKYRMYYKVKESKGLISLKHHPNGLDNSSKIFAHLPIVKSLAGQYSGNVKRVPFSGNLHSTICLVKTS